MNFQIIKNNGSLSNDQDRSEQERLLKTLFVRKEELRALEGRRKALEALKEATMNRRDVEAKALDDQFTDEDDDNDENDAQTLVNDSKTRFLNDEGQLNDVKHRDELKKKLENLQNHKLIVDELLENLTSLQAKSINTKQNKSVIDSSVYVSQSADHTAKQAEKLLSILENEEKLEFVHVFFLKSKIFQSEFVHGLIAENYIQCSHAWKS